MIFSRIPHFGKTVLILALGTLGACETMNAPDPSVTLASVDEKTGAGIFYPPVTNSEVPDIRFPLMDGVGAQQRQLFVDQVNLAAARQGRLPIVIQAVGEGYTSLVFMYLGTEGEITPYLARGLLARLTSVTRFAPPITEMGLSTEFDIYNMAAVLGFERIIVTDGRAFSHEARLVDE